MIDESANELISREIIEYNCLLTNQKIAYQTVKRIIDFLLAFVWLIFGIPLILIFSAAIKIESKGPVIYKQERLGKNGKPFIMFKLRSMFIDSEIDGPKWADKSDSRVTKVGQFIRRTRIDEIPQLFNILKGDMSIVGPRPERLYFTNRFNQDIPGFINRLAVKPGLTGWAQVNGGYDITPKEKFMLDMEYIEKMSLAVDLKIICKTMAIVLTGYGAR